MAAGDVTRTTRAALANVGNLNSLADNQAECFGEVDSGVYLDHQVHINIPLQSGQSGGTYDLYMVESSDGAEWTDDIDPTADVNTNVAAKISDAILIASVDATYDASNRTVAEFHFNVGDYVSFPHAYFGFVLDNNNTGAAIPATPACEGDYESVSIAAS